MAIPYFSQKFQRSLSFYGQMPAEKGWVQLIRGYFSYSSPQKGENEEHYLRRSVRQITSDPNDVIFIHLKSPDEPGHDGQPLMKVQAIETIDRYFMTPLLKRLDPGDLCVVTSDHATPCELGIHSADPVPVILYGGSISPDSTRAFGERYAAAGGLPIHRAVDLLP